MFLLSLMTNKDSYNTQTIQCVNNTVFRKRFQLPGSGTGSGTLQPVPWNRLLHQITTSECWTFRKQHKIIRVSYAYFIFWIIRQYFYVW